MGFGNSHISARWINGAALFVVGLSSFQINQKTIHLFLSYPVIL